MADRIDEFEKVLEGGSRENRFKVKFTLPNGVPGDIRKLSLLVLSTNTPGKTRGKIELKHSGKTHRIAGDDLADETFPCTVKVPKNVKDLYDTLFAWYKLPETSEDYKVETVFEQLDIQNNVVYSFKATGVWLSVLPQLTMNQESSDTIQQIDLEFTLDDVENI